MSIALTIVLIAFCIQGLVKFAVGFLVPYRTRITGSRPTTAATAASSASTTASPWSSSSRCVVLLFLTDMQELSFITGLVVGMLVIQIFFHRFSEPLDAEQAPESAAAPRKLMSYAIQAHPGLAWREIAADDSPVRLGSLRAHRPPSRLARTLRCSWPGSAATRARRQPRYIRRRQPHTATRCRGRSRPRTPWPPNTAATHRTRGSTRNR